MYKTCTYINWGEDVNAAWVMCETFNDVIDVCLFYLIMFPKLEINDFKKLLINLVDPARLCPGLKYRRTGTPNPPPPAGTFPPGTWRPQAGHSPAPSGLF
jgi:hypothetical protein